MGIISAAKWAAGTGVRLRRLPRWLDRRARTIPPTHQSLPETPSTARPGGGGVELIVVNQGEHDVSGGTDEEAYLAALKTLVDNYRRIWAGTCPSSTASSAR